MIAVRKKLLAIAMVGGVTLSALAANPGKEVSISDLLEAGHFRQARPLVEARLQKNPKDPQALYFMSRVKAAFSDLEGAISLLQQAIAIDSGKAQYHEFLGELSGSKAQHANMFSAMGLARSVKKEGEIALQIDPKLADAYQLLIQFYLQAPGMVGGDKERARQLAEKLLEIDPVQGSLERARLAARDKDPAMAEEFLLKAVKAGPTNYEALISLGGFYNNEKKYAQAEKPLQQALKLDGTRVGAYSVIAYTYAAQQRWADLDALLAQAEKNVPDDLSPTYQAGRALLVEGKDLPRAEKYFRKYLTKDPEGGTATLAHAHWRLGLVLEKQGRKPEAINEIQTAVNLKPDLEDAKKDLKRLK